MASSQQVDNIEHWFAVYTLKLLSVHAVKYSTAFTRGISNSAVMSDDHDVVSETFLLSLFLPVSFRVILQRQIQRYSDMNNV